MSWNVFLKCCNVELLLFLISNYDASFLFIDFPADLRLTERMGLRGNKDMCALMITLIESKLQLTRNKS